MKTKKSFSYALSVCLIALLSCLFVACANEDLEIASVPTNLTLNISNNTGYSTGELTLQPSGTSIGNIRIDLGQIKIEVDADQLGKVSLTGQSNPEITDEPTETAMTRHGAKTFSFSDSQTATAIWNYLYEQIAKNHWELVDVQYVDYDSEFANDEKTVSRITLNFDVVCQQVGNQTDVKKFPLSPGYYQYVKGAEIDDTAIVTTDDQIGGSTADVTAAEAAFTAQAWLKLTQTSITVPKEQFGKVSLTQAGTPQTTAITKTDSIGEQITFTDKFADSQNAAGTLRNAHSKNAEFYYSITSLQYVDYTATAVNDKTYLITLHYRGSYVHSNGTKRGVFELYPKYYQVLEEEKPAELTYQVDSTYTTLSSGSMIWKATITRSDGKKWEQRKTIAFIGDVHGRDVFGVSKAEVVDTKDSHKKRDEMCTTETEGDWKIVTDYETWRWERYFANPENKELTAETEIVFWTKQLTFKDPETGWTLTTKPLVKNCETTQDEIVQESSAPQTKQDGDHDHDYTYVGSHKLTVNCTLDGNYFHSSTATSYLYKW